MDGGHFEKRLQLLFVCLASWFVGYGGMWAGKWIIAAIFGDASSVSSALTIAYFRSSMADEAGQTFRFLDVAARNLSHLACPAILAAAIYVVAVMVALGRKRGGIRSWFVDGRQNFVPLGVLATLPFCWYLTVGNHSYIHHWFTYRTLVVSIFAILCAFPFPVPIGRKAMQKP